MLNVRQALFQANNLFVLFSQGVAGAVIDSKKLLQKQTVGLSYGCRNLARSGKPLGKNVCIQLRIYGHDNQITIARFAVIVG